MKTFRSALFILLLVVICNQCNGKSHSISRDERKLLERLEEVLEEREILKDAEVTQAEENVEQALEEGRFKLQQLKEKQRLYKELGIDGKIKKGRARLFKSTSGSRKRQFRAYRLLCAKKALVRITGKTLAELAQDENYVVAWEEATRRADTEEARLFSSRVKRGTDCSGASDQYRTINGTCNNLANQEWGSAGATAPRFQTEVYEDEVREPRLASDGGELPTPRTLSNSFFSVPDGQTAADEEGFNTLMSMFWGQFIDHDIVLTPTYTGEDGDTITCCVNGAPENRDECLAMALTPEVALNNSTCMEFTRSQEAVDISLKGKQLINEITSFIDASMVYGSSDEELSALRGEGAKMLVNGAANGDLLPDDSSDAAICSLDGADSDDYCQKAGDVRVNVQPGLGLMHLLFLREHNRIVDELINNGWTDNEKIFNEARKIVGAEIQHITYGEYLKNLFTDETIEKYGLSLLDSGHSSSYDTTCNPGVAVGFSTAAFRFGHSQIPHQLAYMQNSADPTSLTQVTAMETALLNPHMLINQAGAHVHDLLTYSSNVPASKADGQFNDAIRNKLFNEPKDLTSLNINRGRDHGLPPYLVWRSWCGLSVPSDAQAFRELVDITGTDARLLLDVYGNLNDIDLYVGGMLERRIIGDSSYVGPTFACILGQQFKQLKECDRFWYERPAPEGFSTDKLAEIRKVSLSSIICDNAADDIFSIQRNALMDSIRKESCALNNRNPSKSAIPRMDLSVWAGTEK